MGRIATNTLKQIELLKERGMNFDISEDKVKEFLLDIGYYRLGFYWQPFEKNTEHFFIEGAKISNVIKLYYLDTDLRNTLHKYLNRIEVNFRTKVVYYGSNTFKTSPTWFVDTTAVEKDFLDKINTHYNEDFLKSNKPIKKHHEKYINDKYAPAWKTLEFFTFGSVLKVFKSLKNNDLKERISKEYGVLNMKKFINLMETIVFVRNTCAHGGVLFDLQTPKGISKMPQFDFNANNRHSLDSMVKVILYILGQISENRQIELKGIVDKLFLEHKENSVVKEIIEQKIGYNYD